MIDFLPLVKIMPIFAVALISPGPDFMMISSMAMSRGRAAGLWATLGIASGVPLYVGLCLFGLGVVFARLHGLVTIIRVFGGIYLVYLAWQLWRASFAPVATDAAPLAGAKQKNPYLVGLLTNVTNPKAIAFFTSIFTLTVPADVNMATELMIIAAMTFMAAAWFSSVVLILSAPRIRQAYLRSSSWIDRICGTFLGLFGIKLLLSTRD